MAVKTPLISLKIVQLFEFARVFRAKIQFAGVPFREIPSTLFQFFVGHASVK